MFKHNILVFTIFISICIGVGSSYKYVADLLTWTQAYENCKRLGMDLAEISDATEYDTVVAFLKTQNSTMHVWISGTDTFQEGFWIGMSTGLPLRFLNWGEGEPDNNQNSNPNGTEDCLEIRPEYDYDYNDQDCISTLHLAASLCK